MSTTITPSTENSNETKPEEPTPETPEQTENKPATSTKGKKPKKKKLSKKELARLRKERAEQERLEQERRDAELRDQREREYEQKKREEQQQRLLEEDKDIHTLRENRISDGQRIRRSQAIKDDWEIFVQCNHFVDCRSEADVNTFISNWRENEETELPPLFEKMHQSNLITTELKQKMEAAEVYQDENEKERCSRQIQELSNLIRQKIEQITMHHLVFSDKYAGAKNEVQVSNSTDGYTYGMWVNLSKNPRNKEIKFPGVVVEIPKPVAMTSIAIRVEIIPDLPQNKDYLFLGNIFKCEFLQLPTPPKRIGTMTLRQSPQHNALVQISYPLRNITAAQPPLNFTLQLPDNFINDDTKDATVVMINGDQINTQHISKVVLDTETNTMKWSSMSVGTFAFAIPRYRHFPLQFWEITSLSPTSVELYIKTKTLLELSITINGDGRCSMEQPFQFSGLTPVAALEFLAKKGINLVAPEQCAEVTPKTADLEEVLNRGLADTATGFVVTWSKWNAMLPPDRAMLVMKQQKSFDEPVEVEPVKTKADEEEEEEDSNETVKDWSAILAKSNHIIEVPYTENKEECVTQPINDAQIHQHILPMFFERASDEVKDRVRKCPCFLSNALLYFLGQLRLFSMTQ